MIELSIRLPSDLGDDLESLEAELAALPEVRLAPTGRPDGAALLDPATVALAVSTLLAPVLGAFATWLLTRRDRQAGSPIVIVVTTVDKTVLAEVVDGVVDPDALQRLGEVSGVVRIAEATDDDLSRGDG